MKNTTLTIWFPMSVNPVWKGVYEISTTSTMPAYSKWTGSFWCTKSRFSSMAAKYTDRSTECYLPGCKWRGLAAQPKEPA